MADHEYFFLIPFLYFLAILIAGIFYKTSILIGIAIPLVVLVIASKFH